MESVTEEGSDPERDVLLDSKDGTTSQPQRMDDYIFTFEYRTPSKIIPITAFPCLQSTKYTPHLHWTSTNPQSSSLHSTILSNPLNYYVAPNQVDHKFKSPLNDSNMLCTTELRDRGVLHLKEHSQPTNREIRRLLGDWYCQDRGFARQCRKHEAMNPYPNINMNIGWNRPRYELEQHFKYRAGTVEERMAIEEGFARFSLRRQLDPLVLTETVCAGIERMFIGTARDKWSRQPGSWWAARKRVFSGIGGEITQEMNLSVMRIKGGVTLWLEESGPRGQATPSNKRSYVDIDYEVDVTTSDDVELETRIAKRFKHGRGKSEAVMSEAWRARRRAQEKKAGRWTDGTMAMDRLWSTFHWVLNT